jgi:hypothetical protein
MTRDHHAPTDSTPGTPSLTRWVGWPALEAAAPAGVPVGVPPAEWVDRGRTALASLIDPGIGFDHDGEAPVPGRPGVSTPTG